MVLQNYLANGVIDFVNAGVMLVRYLSRAFALLYKMWLVNLLRFR